MQLISPTLKKFCFFSYLFFTLTLLGNFIDAADLSSTDSLLLGSKIDPQENLKNDPLLTIRVPPLFWYELDRKTQRKFLMTLLLYWSGRDPTGKFNLFTPFYYHFKTPEEETRILIPFHIRTRSEKSELSLWGTYFYKKSLLSQTRSIFPFYLNVFTPENQFTLFPFFFRQKSREIDSTVLFPLFWSFLLKEPTQKSYQTLIPFYLKVKEEEGMSRTIFSPLFWSFKDSTISQGFLPPYYWSHSPSAKTEVGFPIYWRFLRKKEEKTKDTQVIFPWFHHRSNGNRFRGFAPIYWGITKVFEDEFSTTTFKNEDVYHLFLPIFFSSKKVDGNKKVITPLLSRFHDPDGKEYGHFGLHFFSRDIWGGKTEGFFPFLYYRKEPDFFRFRFLTFYMATDKKKEHLENSFFPLFRYQRDFDREQFSSLVLGFYRDKDPDQSRGFMIPYFWKTEYRPDDPHRTILVRQRFLFPLIWYFQSETGKTIVVPPLIAFHEEKKAKISLVAPLYFQRKKGEDQLTIVPPFMVRKSSEQQWLGTFFLFWQRGKENRTSFTFFPLYRKSNFPNGTAVFLPGFYFLRKGSETEGVALPYLWDHRGKTQYKILPPIYWHFKRPTWNLKTFFPLYQLKTERLIEKGIFPLWAKTDPVTVTSSTKTSQHFLANSHRVLPFYFYRKFKHGSNLVLPILLGQIEKRVGADEQESIQGRFLLLNYWEKSPTHFLNRFDPLYSYQNSPEKKGFSIPTVLFPLWQYEREELGSDEGETVRGAFFPYYWTFSKRRSQNWVIPFFYQARKRELNGEKEVAKTRWLLTYYASQDHNSSEKKTLLVPFYWHFSNQDESSTIVPPLWIQSGPNFKRQIIFPLWWFRKRDQQTHSVLFPLFLNSSDPTTKRRLTVFPGYWYREDAESSALLAGIFFQKNHFVKQERMTTLFPIFWLSRSPEQTTSSIFALFWRWKGEGESMTTLFPLYFQHQRANLDWKIAFPIFWRFKTAETEVHVLPPYFSILSHSSQTKTTGFALLWSYTRNQRENWKNLQFFGGLFGFEKRGEDKKLTLFYFIHL